MAKSKRKKPETSNAVQILHKRLIRDNPERLAALQRERVHAKIAKMIYDLRNQAELTQKELAKLSGTSHSQISRIEDSDYDGHSLATLRKIAAVFGARVEIRFLPASPRKKSLNAPSGKRIAIPEAIA